MLNGSYLGKCVGSGTVIWEARQKLASGEIDQETFMDLAASSAPSVGHCNTMGTALTMNCLIEVLGMSLSGSASIPAPYRERQQSAYFTGKRIVEMVREDLTPEKILTREAFENAIVVCAAIGGSTNAPIHINAIAAHAGIELNMKDWQERGQKINQIVNCQPVGKYLGEEFHKAGGVPAVMKQLLQAGLLHNNPLTVTGKSCGENCKDSDIIDTDVIKSVEEPVTFNSGFMVLSGNLFDSAVMKISAISDSFKQRFLLHPDHPNVFEAKIVVFEGPEDYHQRIEDDALNIDESTVLVMRGVGPKGYPGSAEVVNMQPPAHLIKKGIVDLPTIGDGRQSGTSAAPSILNASPEAAVGGGLAILQDGDIIKVDLNKATVNVKLTDQEIATRKDNLVHSDLRNQTWWQEIYREHVEQMGDGAVFSEMLKYRKIVKDTPRHSH